MASDVTIHSGVEGYRDVVQHVIKYGTKCSPRGLPTLDAGHTVVEIEEPFGALPLGLGRKLSRRIAAAEAVQLIGGFSNPDLLPDSFASYREPDGTFYGAYGDRIGLQLLGVVNRLKDDRDSRQAVINLWDGTRDFAPDKRDYPCTVALGFRIFAGYLEMNTVMRSNDVWLGVPYDWFQFTQLQLTIASILGVSPGRYRHTAWSLHIYERDLEKVDQLHAPSRPLEWQPSGLGDTTSDPYEVLIRARHIPYEDLRVMSESDKWYREQLRDHG